MGITLSILKSMTKESTFKSPNANAYKVLEAAVAAQKRHRVIAVLEPAAERRYGASER